MQPKTEIESYASVLRWSVEGAEKAIVFTKDNPQNKSYDSSLDFTKSLNNGVSNTYDQTNPRAGGNINFLYLFKVLKASKRMVKRYVAE